MEFVTITSRMPELMSVIVQTIIVLNFACLWRQTFFLCSSRSNIIREWGKNNVLFTSATDIILQALDSQINRMIASYFSYQGRRYNHYYIFVFYNIVHLTILYNLKFKLHLYLVQFSRNTLGPHDGPNYKGAQKIFCFSIGYSSNHRLHRIYTKISNMQRLFN